MYNIYCDGAYSSSRKQGGCAFIILNDQNQVVVEYNKMFKNTTNNQMEMLACIIALESIKIPSEISIYSDSMYVVGTMTLNWKRRKNKKLWKRFDDAVLKHTNVNFYHVKGHEDNYYNNRCDQLAVEASQQ